MVAAHENDELAKNSDDEKKIEKVAEKLVIKRKHFKKDKHGTFHGQSQSPGVCNQGEVDCSYKSIEDRNPVDPEHRIEPCFNCADWGHLRKNCPRKTKLYPLIINTCLSGKGDFLGVDRSIHDMPTVSSHKSTNA